jgi:hypothetical protein
VGTTWGHSELNLKYIHIHAVIYHKRSAVVSFRSVCWGTVGLDCLEGKILSPIWLTNKAKVLCRLSDSSQFLLHLLHLNALRQLRHIFRLPPVSMLKTYEKMRGSHVQVDHLPLRKGAGFLSHCSGTI